MKATYHSDRGDKSALLMVQTSEFSYEKSPVYIPRTAVVGKEPGDEIEVPDNLDIVPFMDYETGEPRTTKTGETLMVFK